jgi:nicotinamide riboside kinase
MSKQKIQIVFTGAQGTGKTTLVNELAKEGIKTLSIAREQAENTGWTSDTPGTVEYQKELYNNLYKAISSKKSFLSDRALSCVAAYTFMHALNNPDDKKLKKLADSQYEKFCKFHNDNQNVIIVYTPIEFPVENDGLRSINEKERTTIDFLIKNILDTTGANYITVTGTVEERLAQIKENLK